MANLSTRRDMLAGTGLAAASLAAGTSVLSATDSLDPDRALLNLREPFDRTWAAYKAALGTYALAEASVWRRQSAEPSVSRKKIEAEEGLIVADKLVDETESANRKIVEAMCEIPSRTIEGLAFKAHVSLHHEDNRYEELVTSIMDDVLAMAGGAVPIAAKTLANGRC